MQLRSALLAATILATPIAASAQPVTGLYVGLGAGVDVTTQESIKRIGLPAFLTGGGPILPTSNSNLNGSTGFAGDVSLGWGFGNGLRAEIQGIYTNNHSSGFSNLPVLALGANGGSTEQKYGGMFNAIYDFYGLSPWIVPYIGVGAGYAWINENWHVYNTVPVTTGLLAPPAITTFGPGGLNASGRSTEGSFAYQAMIGAAFPLPQVMPGLALTLDYRFLGTTSNRSYTGVLRASPTTGGLVTTPAGVTFGPSHNNIILVGLRYNFGVAPPPPPAPAPVPAQAPARSYLVFFDWDKATLTDRARQIIREAADNSTKVQYTRIEVNGYTDTSGTHQYNQRLSVRRAQAVQAELIKNGVPQNAITIQGFGDTHLLVPTGPGVREPQNRRVEIIIR